MSLLCCFLCLQLDIDVDVSANIYYSYSSSNLFFIHPGFANPSVSRGLLGFSLNPAALNNIESAEIMASGTSAMRAELLTEFAIPFDTLAPIVDTVEFPTELSVQQVGGLDFFGFSMNIRGWKLGIGFHDGDYIGLDFSGSSTPNADYAFDYEYTLTHADITEIPEGDSIPVNISLEAEGDLSFTAEGVGAFRTRSLVFAAAHTLFGLDAGFGFQMTPVSIVGNFSSLFNGSVHSGGSVSVEAVQDWTIDASFEVEIDADSILEC